MSSAARLEAPGALPAREPARGARAWVGYELARALRPRRAAALYALALLPALAVGLLGWVARLHGAEAGAMMSPGFYASLFELELKTVIFLGCAWLFIQLVRGELTGRTLHYAWLAPVRRSRLGWGKYLAGELAALAIFAGGTLLSRLLLLWLRGQPLLAAPALRSLFGYAGAAALACLGYGAVFFLFGACFRQALFPALAFYGWEQINFLLPSWLQRCSMIYYLHALRPGALPQHAWGFVPPPISIAAAAAWLLALSGVLAGLAVRRFARLEIYYGGEE